MPFAITVSTLLSKVITPIFLTALYFIAITPIGIIMRLTGKGPFGRETGAGESKLLEDPDHSSQNPSDYEKQF